MGTMPLSLTKGVIGLRLDYLSQFASIRQHVRDRFANWLNTMAPNGENDLGHPDHPVNVMRTIQVHGITVDVLGDKKSPFVAKINYLRAHEPPVDPSWYHLGDGAHYVRNDATLEPGNQDATGNRTAFMQWWTGHAAGANPRIFREIAEKVIEAIDSEKPRLEYWWDCSIHDGATVELFLQDTIARVLFRTDHTAVHPDPNLPKREPDPEPPDPTAPFVPGN